MGAHRTPSRLRTHSVKGLDWDLFTAVDRALDRLDEFLRTERDFVRVGLVRSAVDATGTATYRFTWKQSLTGNVRMYVVKIKGSAL